MKLKKLSLRWLAGSELEVWFAELARRARDLSGACLFDKGAPAPPMDGRLRPAAGPDAAVPGKVSAGTYLLHQSRLGALGQSLIARSPLPWESPASVGPIIFWYRSVTGECAWEGAWRSPPAPNKQSGGGFLHHALAKPLPLLQTRGKQ